jgi:phosphotransferase system enzyme I (PtsP)
VEVGAEGVGLLRSEFLLLDRETPPDEREQLRAFTKVFEALGSDRPLTLRLADIGGDKEIPYLKLPHEANPFLGLRGYRLAMIKDRPDLRALFASQVAAALRAAAATGGALRIMAPMISVRAEVDDLLALIKAVRAELAARGEVAAEYPAAIGVMIEVPSAVYQTYAIAKKVNFISVGSNDLTQYLLAVDRNNAKVANLYNSFHPAVLMALTHIVHEAHRAGIPVSICGEMAGDPLAGVLLLGIGFDVLSMSASRLLRIKWVIRQFSFEKAKALVEEVLAMEDATAIRARLEFELESVGLGSLIHAGRN